MHRLHLISVNTNRIQKLAKIIGRRITQKRVLSESQFGTGKITPQRIFILDSINFCFWEKKGKQKWTIEHPKGQVYDGWNALVASFDRALENDIPLLDPGYLSGLSETDAHHTFRGTEGKRIPLLKQRTAILRESGRILQKDFNGNIKNLIKQADYDAANIALTTIKHFPSFRDSSRINGRKVNFFKRAQIFAYDLSLLKDMNMTNIENLTAFADYKLPQLLRSFGILRYRRSLARKVDTMELISKHNREEIEIRSATIWVCDQIVKILNVPAVTVDNALWYLSHSGARTMKPYHRTLTICY